MCSSYLGPWESTGPEGHVLESPSSGRPVRAGREEVLSETRQRAWQSAADKRLPWHPTTAAALPQLFLFQFFFFLLNDTLTWKYGNFQDFFKFCEQEFPKVTTYNEHSYAPSPSFNNVYLWPIPILSNTSPYFPPS